MAKENKAPFIFLCRTVRMVIIIYGIYFILVTILNMTLKETTGKIISVNEYEGTYTEIKSNEIAIRGKDIYYHYNLNETDYSGRRLSNFLIFPSFDLNLNDNILVYYCAFFPQYAVLFKGNLIYAFYNLLPLIILEIILFVLRGLILRPLGRLKSIKPRMQIPYENNNPAACGGVVDSE